MPRVMGKVRHSEDANSAWIALPLMDPLDGKLLFIQPSDQGLPPKRPSSLFGGKNPSLFLFAFVRSSLTHHLRSFVGRRADSCPIGVRIPVAWLRGSHVNNACACLIHYVSGLFSIPTVFSSPYIKYGQIIIHKYGKSLTNRSSSYELSEMWTCMPAPYASCYATLLHFSRYCDVRVKMLYLLFVCFIYMLFVWKLL